MTIIGAHPVAKWAPVAAGKARPPRAMLAPPSVVDGEMTCTVSFDSGNGRPESALLLAVSQRDGRWNVVLKNGALASLDAFLGLEEVDHALHLLKDDVGDEESVLVKLDWPAPADRALLLLVHSQLDAIGDEIDFASEDLALPSTVAAAVAARAMAARRAGAAARDFLAVASLFDLERGVIALRRSVADRFASTPGEDVAFDGSGRSFALASCQFPAGMLDGGSVCQRTALDDSAIGPAERSMWRLGHELEVDAGIAFTVLAGDQVYVDATAGLFDPAKLLDRFSFAYKSMRRNKGLQRVLRVANHAVLPLLDDHELGSDNWEPRAPAPPSEQEKEDLRPGLRNYRLQQATMWPAPPRNTQTLWEGRAVDAWQFFFANTRTLRTGRDVTNWRTATILGDEQQQALLDWITPGAVQDEAAPVAPRFIVSSSILLPRLLSLRGHGTACLAADSWCGYPGSLHAVLAQIYETRARGVVFLSGDEHLSCVATITIRRVGDPRPPVVTHSVHGSALYAPYPFANSAEADFAADETFDFDHPHSEDGSTPNYTCKVSTAFSRCGNGFVVLTPAQRRAGTWRLGLRFLGADGSTQAHTCDL